MIHCNCFLPSKNAYLLFIAPKAAMKTKFKVVELFELWDQRQAEQAMLVLYSWNKTSPLVSGSH